MKLEYCQCYETHDLVPQTICKFYSWKIEIPELPIDCTQKGHLPNIGPSCRPFISKSRPCAAFAVFTNVVLFNPSLHCWGCWSVFTKTSNRQIPPVAMVISLYLRWLSAPDRKFCKTCYTGAKKNYCGYHEARETKHYGKNHSIWSYFKISNNIVVDCWIETPAATLTAIPECYSRTAVSVISETITRRTFTSTDSPNILNKCSSVSGGLFWDNALGFHCKTSLPQSHPAFLTVLYFHHPIS